MNAPLAKSANHLVNLQLGDLYELGKILVTTGFLPNAIKTPEQAVAVMLKGQELQVPPMYALSNIAVIQGKPVANAELMLALIYRDHGDDAIMFTQSSAEVCTIAYRRRSWRQAQTQSYTIQDARTAGLLGNQTWQKYPQAMLRARCVSAVARLAFPDSIGGMYTPEELGAQVVVNDEGTVEIVDVTPPPQIVEVPRPAKPEVTVDQAAELFWERFGHALGGNDWSLVQRLIDTDEGEPMTLGGWRNAWKYVDQALAAEAERAA